MVGNTPYAKRHTPRTELVLVQSSMSWDLKIAFNHSFLYDAGARSVLDAFFNLKNASEKDAKNITPSIGQLEKRTSSLATDVV